MYLEDTATADADGSSWYLVTAKTLLGHFGVHLGGNFDEFGNFIDSELVVSNVGAQLRSGFS